MSDTKANADDVMKLLDQGHIVVLWRNGLGSYTAVCVKNGSRVYYAINDQVDLAIGWDGVSGIDAPENREFGDEMPGVVETDDHTPSQALYRLTEKATTGRIA